ncbi:hypothetical protein LEN26_004327 [Aphanomyces euteiches]|nr:hypothetical protein LEN26_004327 [Aphanomyces euteiches]
MGNQLDLKLSSGWLTGFKKRHNIREFILHGESGNADLEAAKQAVPELMKLTESYQLRVIFNCDESGLPWNAEPNRCLATKPRAGKKLSKKRVSVLFTVNADGSEKLPPLVIGSAARPRCFNGKSPWEHGFTYCSNKKSWMTRSIFEDWLENLNEVIARENRKILLLLDNVSTHKEVKPMSNVKLHFLPVNTTSLLQPQDAGIIAATKKRHKAKLMQNAVERSDAGVVNPFKCTLHESLQWLYEAWSEVSAQTISNCWRHVRYVAQYEPEELLVLRFSELNLG